MNKLCDSLEVLPNTAFESALNTRDSLPDQGEIEVLLFYIL